MRTPIIAYIAALIAMAIMDGAWLSFATSKIYKPGIGHLMAASPNIPAAILFYLLYPIALTYLVTLPATTSASPAAALTRGAVLGLTAYGTYDLTSLAILSNWPVSITIIDIIWGGILTGATAAIATAITIRFE